MGVRIILQDKNAIEVSSIKNFPQHQFINRIARISAREIANKYTMKILCTQFSDKAILSYGNFWESLHFNIDHWPVQVDSRKGIYFLIFWLVKVVKVTSRFLRFDSCKVSLCLRHFKICHICHDLVAIKKNIAREPPKSVWKGGNVVK